MAAGTYTLQWYSVNSRETVGADKLTVEGSVEGLHLKEFFLLLSSTGLAYRRCELAWVNGDQIGVNFLKQGDKKKKAAAAKRDAQSTGA